MNTKKFKLSLVSGVEGKSLYISDNGNSGFRVSGNKPWGGGRTLADWEVSSVEFLEKARKQVNNGKVIIKVSNSEGIWSYTFDELSNEKVEKEFICDWKELFENVSEYEY
ncbi:hypothetical protein [Enterococcus avium]|uniref:hypothetical protein n=1 Tax=Enterococcus avium TaxID=33945 RepID=UPI0022E06ED3|nr:hypothetical protein [Enterococcus avium]